MFHQAGGYGYGYGQSRKGQAAIHLRPGATHFDLLACWLWLHGNQKSCWRERRHLPFVLACLLKPDPQQLLCAQFLCPLAIMFRFAVFAMLCLHLLPGHAMRAIQGARCEWQLRPSQVGPVRPTMGHQSGMVWPMDFVAMKQIPQKRSAALIMQRGCRMRAPSTSVAGCQQLAKSGKQVNLCVTWSAENKRWTHAAPTKRKLWRCWKLVKTAMPSFGAMREVANGKAPHNLATSWVPGHRGRRIPWTTTRGVGVCHRTAYTAMAMPCGRTAWATGRRITGSISTSRLVDAWARINVEMSWAH